MSTTPILLDSNCYLRLAEKIHPLLNIQFGVENYKLFVIKDFEAEFKRSARLQSKFSWVNEQKYVLNRRTSFPLPHQKRRAVEIGTKALIDYIRRNGLTVSNVDARALAVGRACNVAVATDDRDMRRLANEYGITTVKTITVVSRMQKAGHVEMDLVRNLVVHWIEHRDRPTKLSSDYRRLFKEPLPAAIPTS